MLVEALLDFPRLAASDVRERRDPLSNFWYRESPLAGAADVTPDTALQVTAVYACVRILAESVASLPLMVYRRLPGGGKDRAPEHPLYNALHQKPNWWQTSFEWREMLMGHLALRGNAYVQLSGVRPDGAVTDLTPLHPDNVRCRIEDGLVRYDVRGADHVWRPVPAERIMHLRGLCSDSVRGLSPIEMERNAVGNALSTDVYAGSFFANGARPGGVLEHPGVLKDPGRENIRKAWQDLHGGPQNANRVAILEEGMKWHEVGMTNDDAQFLETRKYNVTDIARIFRIPPHMIGDLERATFSNIEHQSIEFVIHTLRPWLVRIEQRFNASLLRNDPDFFCEFLVDGLLRGDAQARSNALQIQFMNGALSIDEWREIENRNPLPDGLGGQHFVPVNLARLDAPAEVGPAEPAVDPAAEDITFKREVVKGLIADGTIGDVIFNLTDGRQLLQAVNIPVIADADEEPFLPIVAAAGQLVSGDVITDAAGDVVGGDVVAPEPNQTAEPQRAAETAEDKPGDPTTPESAPDKPTEPAPAPETPPQNTSSDNAALLQVLIADVAERIAGAETRQLGLHVKRCGADRPEFERWAARFYERHGAYVDRALAPLLRIATLAGRGPHDAAALRSALTVEHQAELLQADDPAAWVGLPAETRVSRTIAVLQAELLGDNGHEVPENDGVDRGQCVGAAAE